jgi:hypothetical protein
LAVYLVARLAAPLVQNWGTELIATSWTTTIAKLANKALAHLSLRQPYQRLQLHRWAAHLWVDLPFVFIFNPRASKRIF